MKQARTYEKKVRKLLRQLPKSRQQPGADDVDPVRIMIEAIMQADSTSTQAARAMRLIESEYVDFNELRVSPIKDLIECVGTEYPDIRRKAEELLAALGGVYARSSAISLAYLADKTKREQRRLLSELGLREYAVGSVLLLGLDRHAVPVDRDLAESLEMDGYVHPGSEVGDIQSFLERIVSRSKCRAVHEFFRAFVQKHSKALAKKRKAERAAAEKARIEAEKRAAEEKKKREEEEARAAAAAKKRAAKKRRKAAKRAKAKVKAKKTAATRKKKATRKAASGARRAKKVRKARKASPSKARAALKSATAKRKKKSKTKAAARTKKK
jgi:hypothetical protein